MKKFAFLILLALLSFAANAQKGGKHDRMRSDTINVDSLQYELVIIDPDFDTWLLTQPPENFYSNDYYETYNVQYTAEWNRRYLTNAGSNLYEYYIDYNPNIKYDIDLNYKLFYYFKFFEQKNHVHLLPGKR